MPLPLPDHGEPHDAFMSRCMADDAMNAEFPDQDQRAAVCERQWQAEDKLCRLDLEVRMSEPTEAGEFTGIASVFNETDLMGDAVAPGAFRKSLAAHRRAGRLPLMLWSHQLDQPIGRWLDIRETAQGLMVKGKLLLSTAKGADAYAMLKEGVVDGLSIGFRTVKAARGKLGRILEEIALAEISLVSMPALASARVTSVKSSPRRETALPLDGAPTMSVNVAVPDDAAETHDLPPEVLERINALEAKAATIDQLSVQLDQVQTRLARPSARIETRENQGELEHKAFLSWCRKGNEGLSDLERKTLSTITASPGTGGWNLVPETFLRELLRNLVEFSPMRSVARVQQVSGNPVILPKRLAGLTAAWVPEEAEHGLSEPAYGQQSIPIFEARVTTEVTNALLEDAAFDVAAELARDFGEEFARLESVAFVKGNGTTEPQGFQTAATFVTSQGNLTADALIDLYHSIPSVYSNRGTWLMPRSAMASVRKLKATGTGNYLWVESLQPGNPPTILGRPVVEFSDLTGGGSPSLATVAFGDWNQAYRIFDRVGLEVLRDPFTSATRSVVRFHARKRVGAARWSTLPRCVA